MEMTKRAKIMLLAVAALMIVAAILLNNSIAGQDPYAPIAEELREHGYTLQNTDFFNAGSFPDSCIASVLAGEELSEAVAAGRAAGFPADVEAVGDITLLLLSLENEDVVTIFTRNGHIELCFIQRLGTNELRPIS